MKLKNSIRHPLVLCSLLITFLAFVLFNLINIGEYSDSHTRFLEMLGRNDEVYYFIYLRSIWALLLTVIVALIAVLVIKKIPRLFSSKTRSVPRALLLLVCGLLLCDFLFCRVADVILLVFRRDILGLDLLFKIGYGGAGLLSDLLTPLIEIVFNPELRLDYFIYSLFSSAVPFLLLFFSILGFAKAVIKGVPAAANFSLPCSPENPAPVQSSGNITGSPIKAFFSRYSLELFLGISAAVLLFVFAYSAHLYVIRHILCAVWYPLFPSALFFVLKARGAAAPSLAATGTAKKLTPLFIVLCTGAIAGAYYLFFSSTLPLGTVSVGFKALAGALALCFLALCYLIRSRGSEYYLLLCISAEALCALVQFNLTFSYLTSRGQFYFLVNFTPVMFFVGLALCIFICARTRRVGPAAQ